MIIEKQRITWTGIGPQIGWDIVLSKEEANHLIEALEHVLRTGEIVKVDMAGAPAVGTDSDRVFQVFIVPGA